MPHIKTQYLSLAQGHQGRRPHNDENKEEDEEVEDNDKYNNNDKGNSSLGFDR